MKTAIPKHWDYVTDVLVIGSGAAGLTAALTAKAHGANVVLIEKTNAVGGATAISNGLLWIPMNQHQEKAGIQDNRAEAYSYLQHIAADRISSSLVNTLLDKGPEMLAYIENHSPLSCKICEGYPDYHAEWPGGKLIGRTLDPGLFDSDLLGEWKDHIRKSPYWGLTPVTYNEATAWGLFRSPEGVDLHLIADRLSKGMLGFGEGLIAQLLMACLDHGIHPLLRMPARSLIQDESGTVIGIQAQRDGQTIYIKADQGVILATGGFEWNKDLMQRFFAGPMPQTAATPPYNEGDALLMAMEVGASLHSMADACYAAGLQIPDEQYDGQSLIRCSRTERSLPHSFIVNKYGHRFTNEAHNQHDFSTTFTHYDPVKGEYPNLSAWLIMDQAFFDQYRFLNTLPGDKPPGWLVKADTLAALATKIAVDATHLIQTTDAFNGYAKTGYDLQFHRGENAYDRFHGDPNHLPNPCLGTVEKPPFYAAPLHFITLGTKGGPEIDEFGRVLDIRHRPIKGLYAAGNAAMAITGGRSGGDGSAIGAAMVFGYLAGQHAAAQTNHYAHPPKLQAQA